MHFLYSLVADLGALVILYTLSILYIAFAFLLRYKLALYKYRYLAVGVCK